MHLATWVCLWRDWPKVVSRNGDHDAARGSISAACAHCSVGCEGLIWPVLVAHFLQNSAAHISHTGRGEIVQVWQCSIA